MKHRYSLTAHRVASILFTLGALVFVTPTALALGPELPPAPKRWVTDNSGLLGEGARAELDRRLEEYQRTSGHQFLIYIDRTTAGVPIEDFAVRAFEAWRVGRSGIDDGLAIFVFSEDRAVRIEVGYGLEGVVPDARAARVIREHLGPGLAAGDPAGALGRSLDALMALVDAPESETSSPAPPADSPGLSLPEKIIVAILVIGFLILLITNPSLAIMLLVDILTSSGGGGGSRGGGGFSGGGGRSGGGGASGRW